MKCILMNKNTEILTAEYDAELKVFSKIHEVRHIDYAPVILEKSFREGKNFRYDLSEWFKGRGIPSWRDDLDLLLSRLRISAASELLDKAFALSLSDQYWIKPYDSQIEYKDINFFEHDFKDSEFANATFSDKTEQLQEVSLISPNNTTDGRLKKTWVIENGNRYLLKSGYKNEVMQPFNEVLATMICERLGFFHVPYSITMISQKVVSKCPCFIDTATELVPAHQILHNTSDKTDTCETYIKILEDRGIHSAREDLENMLLLDFLMMNEDRHLNNFGIIRDVETLRWRCTAPIFDTGQSLNILDYNDEEIIVNGNGRFFYQTESFHSMLNHIRDLKRFDLGKLDGICEEFDALLHKYTTITHMTDRRIRKICTLLHSRINCINTGS